MIDKMRSTVGGLAGRYPLLGMALLHHQTTRGGPLSFRSRPFLIELYTELPDCPKVVIRKAVQTGASELLIQHMMHQAGWKGRICALVMPTYNKRNGFVQLRINPLLQRIPAYSARTPGGDLAKERKGAGNLSRKRFGAGALLFLSSVTPNDFNEWSGDVGIVDEYDECLPDHLPLLKNRLRESPSPQMIRLGNPGTPRLGISGLYDESDQRRWFHRCGHCRTWQPIDWFENVVCRSDDGVWVPRDKQRVQGARHGGPDIRPVCRTCNRPYERGVMMGAWVAARPDVEERGYWMSRLDDMGDSLFALYIEWMAAQGKTLEVAAFTKSVLGMPHEQSGARLTVEMLDKCIRAEEMDWGGGEHLEPVLVTAGIDVGAVLNIEIAAIRKGEDGEPAREVVFVGAFRTFREIKDALTRYRVNVAVIDHDPEPRKASELRDAFRGSSCTVWLCRFHPTSRAGEMPYGMKINYQSQVITVDRTAVFDVTLDDIVARRCTYPADAFSVLDWSKQMREPVRVFDEARQRFKWTKTDKADHFRLANCYNRVAYDLEAMGGSYSSE